MSCIWRSFRVMQSKYCLARVKTGVCITTNFAIFAIIVQNIAKSALISADRLNIIYVCFAVDIV